VGEVIPEMVDASTEALEEPDAEPPDIRLGTDASDGAGVGFGG
jgi:hypothetical protein